MKNINRRQAVKAIAASGAVIAARTPAHAGTDPDAALIQIETDYLSALRDACDASSREDEYDVPYEIRFGPRIEIGKYDGGNPYYATTDEEVEEAIQLWLAQADESEKRRAEMNDLTREVVERATARYQEETGRVLLSPDERRRRALAYRPSWERIKKAHAEAIAQTDLPRLRAERDAAWERLREIEEKYVSTPAHGPAGYAVKARFIHGEIRDSEYVREGLPGRTLASLMRDLGADPLPVI